MAIATKPMPLEEYLNFDDGADSRYELVDGNLVAIPPESDLNDRIASFLYALPRLKLDRCADFSGRKLSMTMTDVTGQKVTAH